MSLYHIIVTYRLVDCPLLTSCPACFLPFQNELVAQGNDGVVLKVTCMRPTLTEPDKVYALKGLINYHNSKTLSQVSHLSRCMS